VEFIHETGAEVIFQNHYTLARILIEFHEKTEVFSSSHLREAVRQIWAPMFRKDGVLSVLISEETPDRILQLWDGEALTPIFILTVASAWPEPIPGWNMQQQVQSVQRFLYAKHVIDRAETFLGRRFWRDINWEQIDWFNLRGFQNIADLIFDNMMTESAFDVTTHFERLAMFRTPIEQHYAPFFRWHRLCSRGREHTPEAKQLAADLRQQYPDLFRIVQQAQRIEAVIGDSRECPVTYIELPENDLAQLKRGKLITSPHAREVLLYWIPAFDDDIPL
jgi:hypothetical protein